MDISFGRVYGTWVLFSILVVLFCFTPITGFSKVFIQLMNKCSCKSLRVILLPGVYVCKSHSLW